MEDATYYFLDSARMSHFQYHLLYYMSCVKHFVGIPDQRRGRSKYGVEKSKSILMEDASGTCFSMKIFIFKVLKKKGSL